MTLPRGFGRGWDEPKEPTKCKLGRKCGSWNCCTVHNYPEIFTILAIVAIIVIGVVGVKMISDISKIDAINEIDGLNCKDLAVYIADIRDSYRYAEHRYEWLCVTEQIKEFQ